MKTETFSVFQQKDFTFFFSQLELAFLPMLKLCTSFDFISGREHVLTGKLQRKNTDGITCNKKSFKDSTWMHPNIVKHK